MKDKIKQKVSHMEIIREAMHSRGWKAADLSRASGVSTGVISRYFNPRNKKQLNADNLFALLSAVGLLADQSQIVSLVEKKKQVESLLADIEITIQTLKSFLLK